MAYEKQTWETGEVLQASKLNHIEDGISDDSDVLASLINSDSGILNNVISSGSVLDYFNEKYTEQGMYFCINSTDAKDSPQASTSFAYIVMAQSATQAAVLAFLAGSNPSIYQIKKQSGSWGGWLRIDPGDTDFSSLGNTISDALNSLKTATDKAQSTADSADSTASEAQSTADKAISSLTDGSVTKIGTTTVGSASRPIYLNLGVPTALSSTVGGAAQPAYASNGTITACSSTVGSGTKPVYMSSGTITASSSTVGSGVIPMYLSSGTLTASSSTVGSGTKPVYLSSGTLTASSSTVGSGTKPVYLSSGTVTASSSTVGDVQTPIYLNGGTLTSCGQTYYFVVGSSLNIPFQGAGFLTNSRSEIHFSVGTNRPVVGISGATVTNLGTYRLRQNSNYLFGSSASDFVTPSSVSVTVSGYGYLTIVLTFSADSNAMNNDTIGIHTGTALSITFT